MRRSRRKVGDRGYTAPAIPNDHVSKLKLVRVFPERPTSRLNEASRFDFDEALLPGDIWEGDLDADEFVVDKIIDVRSGRKTRYGQIHNQYLIQWKEFATQPGLTKMI